MANTILLSIIIGYYNKYDELMFTLKTISKSKYRDNIEIIVVDDASEEGHKLTNNYILPIKIIRINETEKNYVNPCMAYNIGIQNANSEIIILQNAEVCHIGDIIKYTIENLKENDYYSFSCYGLNSSEHNNEIRDLYNNNKINTDLFKNKIGGNALFSEDIGGWLNHKEYHPVAYHYISAIYKTKLLELGGFDLDYSNGLCHDDDDFIRRIWKYNMNIKIINHPMGIHQWHIPTVRYHNKDLWNVNNNIFLEKLSYQNIPSSFPIPIKYMKRDKFYDNIPKIFNCYWYGNQFSYLNYLCLETFKFYNPDWTINLYRPKNGEHKLVTWWSNEQRTEYTGKNYFDCIEKLKINMIDIDFADIGFKNEASDVHKSDYLRWYLLYNYGGLWSDLDILYTKPIDDLIKTSANDNHDVGLYYFDGVFPIGFIYSIPKHDMFKKLLESVNIYYDSNEYQCIGAVMWGKLWGTDKKLKEQYDNIYILDKDTIYPYRWNEDKHFFYEKNVEWLKENTIGIHWYNGGVNAKKYCSDNDFTSLETTINILINHFILIKLNKYYKNFIEYDFYPFMTLNNKYVCVNDIYSCKDLCSSNAKYIGFDTNGKVFYRSESYELNKYSDNLNNYDGLYIKKTLLYPIPKKIINIYVGLSGVGKSYTIKNYDPCLQYDKIYDYNNKKFMTNNIYKFFLNNMKYDIYYMDGYEYYADNNFSLLKDILNSFNIHIINIYLCYTKLETIIQNQINIKHYTNINKQQMIIDYKYYYNTTSLLLQNKIINNITYYDTYNKENKYILTCDEFINEII